MKKLKILELTNYSSGICGVWQRVKQESVELSKKGYDVKIFTSNATKGSKEIASSTDKLQDIEIIRFPFKKLGGESFMNWDFEKQALEFEPDIIIAHSYRHPHTLKALKIKEQLSKSNKKCKVFLVTHAPFIEGNITRNLSSKLFVTIYDKFIGPKSLIKFDKIITITKWELPYLQRLGIKKQRIRYIPNGIPDEFFISKPQTGKGVLFLGRIAPIKDLETLIRAMKGLDFNLEIVGPTEENYEIKLKKLIKQLKLFNINFYPPVYDLVEKIKKIDSCEIFVLPSKREAMPQSLIEVMARGKIVISSDNPGSKEIITNNKNGFLFKVGDSEELTRLIAREISNPKNKLIKQNAIKTANKFKWSKLIQDLESIF